MSYNFNGATNRAARRLAQKAIEQRLHTIAILAREEEGQQVFQWGANTGEWFSPTLYSMEEAFLYPTTVGLKLQTAG